MNRYSYIKKESLTPTGNINEWVDETTTFFRWRMIDGSPLWEWKMTMFREPFNTWKPMPGNMVAHFENLILPEK